MIKQDNIFSFICWSKMYSCQHTFILSSNRHIWKYWMDCKNRKTGNIPALSKWFTSKKNYVGLHNRKVQIVTRK